VRTHDREGLDDQQLEGGKKSTKAPGTRPANVEGSIRDLQATAGNRAVSDLVAGSRPAVQGSFFGGAFGGLEDWLAKESSGATPGFDASMKEEPADASMKQEPSDNSMKAADASDKWDPSQKIDASDKWDGSQKFDASDKSDASQKFDASDKWDASQKFDASDKWDASQKFDASDKWDASQKFDASDKSEPDLASKGDEVGPQFIELEEFSPPSRKHRGLGSRGRCQAFRWSLRPQRDEFRTPTITTNCLAGQQNVGGRSTDAWRTAGARLAMALNGLRRSCLQPGRLVTRILA
jgi:hypothetical protein